MLPLAAGIHRPAFVSTTLLCTPILDYEEDYLHCYVHHTSNVSYCFNDL